VTSPKLDLAPIIPEFPFRMRDAEILTVAYRSTAEAVARFVPEELGLEVPLPEATEKIRQALKAEGVPPGRAEFVIPGMTLFREKRGYGKGCPWTCLYNEPITYRAEAYPNAVEAIDTLIPLLGLTPPNDETLMAAYGRAFAKVLGRLPHLLA
jgi:hypothetical protein